MLGLAFFILGWEGHSAMVTEGIKMRVRIPKRFILCCLIQQAITIYGLPSSKGLYGRKGHITTRLTPLSRIPATAYIPLYDLLFSIFFKPPAQGVEANVQ